MGLVWNEVLKLGIQHLRFVREWYSKEILGCKEISSVNELDKEFIVYRGIHFGKLLELGIRPTLCRYHRRIPLDKWLIWKVKDLFGYHQSYNLTFEDANRILLHITPNHNLNTSSGGYGDKIRIGLITKLGINYELRTVGGEQPKYLQFPLSRLINHTFNYLINYVNWLLKVYVRELVNRPYLSGLDWNRFDKATKQKVINELNKLVEKLYVEIVNEIKSRGWIITPNLAKLIKDYIVFAIGRSEKLIPNTKYRNWIRQGGWGLYPQSLQNLITNYYIDDYYLQNLTNFVEYVYGRIRPTSPISEGDIVLVSPATLKVDAQLRENLLNYIWNNPNKDVNQLISYVNSQYRNKVITWLTTFQKVQMETFASFDFLYSQPIDGLEVGGIPLIIAVEGLFDFLSLVQLLRYSTNFRDYFVNRIKELCRDNFKVGSIHLISASGLSKFKNIHLFNKVNYLVNGKHLWVGGISISILDNDVRVDNPQPHIRKQLLSLKQSNTFNCIFNYHHFGIKTKDINDFLLSPT